MSSDFLTLKIISNQKVDHHVTQCFLEYLLNILCIENCGIFLQEVCDFLNLNFSYFKLFLKNLIQWNQSFIPLQLTPYLSFNNCDLVLKIYVVAKNERLLKSLIRRNCFCNTVPYYSSVQV